LPLNINYSFNFGVILLFIFIFLLITGLLSVIFYNNNLANSFMLLILHTFNSFFYFVLRVLHNTFANLFFLFMFFHIFRSWFYTSSNNLSVLVTGFIMFILSCGIAFFGYCLPMGQMSYWASIVIFSLLSVVPFGNLILLYLFGSFAISTRTLSLLFFLHFVSPFILLFLFLLHYINLHANLSSSTNKNDILDLTTFYPLFIFIDAFVVFLFLFFFVMFIFFFSWYFFESANFLSFNTLVTPLHIYPDWFLLFPYACLRSIDNKLFGVFLLLFIMVFFFYSPFINSFFNILTIFNFFHVYIIFFFVLLMFVGANPSVFPFSVLVVFLQYFLYFLIFSYFLFLFLLYLVL
jgi:ubiquinol-cytochrome c reductase cytochrome b subunit